MGRRMMLRLLIALPLLIFVISSYQGFVQGQTLSQERSPTLDETLRWLKDTISANAAYQDSILGDIEIKPVSFDSCTLTWKVITRPRSPFTPDEVSMDEVTVRLADLDVRFSERVFTDKDKFIIGFVARNQKEVIKRNKVLSYGKVGGGATFSESTGIVFKDGEIAGRAAKALVHAIKLCQSKEPF